MFKELTLEVSCIMCKEITEIVTTHDGYNNWKSGILIQVALPELTAQERELLISNTCQKCWTKLFDNEEEEQQ